MEILLEARGMALTKEQQIQHLFFTVGVAERDSGLARFPEGQEAHSSAGPETGGTGHRECFALKKIAFPLARRSIESVD